MPDTIFALSSGSGRAGVAVIRISGPATETLLAALAGPAPITPRHATLRTLRCPDDRDALDQALVLWFPGTASFTGEPSAELHVHGGRAVVQDILRALGSWPAARLATPGEFARRAFENGKLDLAQVEALADLIDAETSAQRRQALNGLEGELGAVVAHWREELLAARALIAAEIDFGDEGDVGPEAAAAVDSVLKRILAGIEKVLESVRHGRIVADGLRVAIVGRPNCGKSSLLNALSRSDAAIVSEHAGTTRDVITVKVDWEGYPIVLMDTAGVRDCVDPVERMGIERAVNVRNAADVVLYLDDVGAWEDPALGGPVSGNLIRVRTKSDLGTPPSELADVVLSAHTGAGLDSLMKRLVAEFESTRPAVAPATVVRQRQEQALRAGAACLVRALQVPGAAIELKDHEVRACERSLEVLVGQVGVEDVLGAIFTRFCIGK